MIFDIREDLYVADYNEDGAAISASLLYVYAEEVAHGNRFAHFFRFDTVEDVDLAWARAEKLLKRIRSKYEATGTLDASCWEEMDPRYGSDAYIAMDDLGIFKEREKAEG